ncbi:MAG: methyltransferase [Muribaculaceae bacterium]|nr:methyltransferase [Muribaculaceae bacterium]
MCAMKVKDCVFRMKRFEVRNVSSAMRVSTDAVTLGAWACVPDVCHAVWDLGAGTGILSLMMAQRTECQQSIITGIELDADAAAEADYNFRHSPWSDRLHLVEGNAIEVCAGLNTAQPDLIISNPPYFTQSRQGLISGQQGRALARHGEDMNYGAVIRIAQRYLTEGGRLCMISPTDCEADITWMAALHHMYVRRLTRVATVPDKQASRTMWSLTKEAGACEEDMITIGDGCGGRSAEFNKLTYDFYL